MRYPVAVAAALAQLRYSELMHTDDRAIKTFHARRGRMTKTRIDLLNQVVPQFELPTGNEPLDLRVHLRDENVIVDFGCGMGDATIALLDQGKSVLALDVHTPGICRVAQHAYENGLTKLAVVHGDGVPVLQTGLLAASIETFMVLFPDPWPKVKHNKRRLVQPAFLDVVRGLLTQTGQMVIATDDASYAEFISEVIQGYTPMIRVANTFDLPDTGFHRRGLKLGNTVEIFTLKVPKT